MILSGSIESGTRLSSLVGSASIFRVQRNGSYHRLVTPVMLATETLFKRAVLDEEWQYGRTVYRDFGVCKRTLNCQNYRQSYPAASLTANFAMWRSLALNQSIKFARHLLLLCDDFNHCRLTGLLTSCDLRLVSALPRRGGPHHSPSPVFFEPQFNNNNNSINCVFRNMLTEVCCCI